jgi:hypothetical protein
MAWVGAGLLIGMIAKKAVVSESQLRAFIRETLSRVLKEHEIEHMPDGSVWSDEGEIIRGRRGRGRGRGPQPGTDAYLAPPKLSFPPLADIYPPEEVEMPGSVLEPEEEDPDQLSLDFEPKLR